MCGRGCVVRAWCVRACVGVRRGEGVRGWSSTSTGRARRGVRDVLQENRCHHSSEPRRVLEERGLAHPTRAYTHTRSLVVQNGVRMHKLTTPVWSHAGSSPITSANECKKKHVERRWPTAPAGVNNEELRRCAENTSSASPIRCVVSAAVSATAGDDTDDSDVKAQPGVSAASRPLCRPKCDSSPMPTPSCCASTEAAVLAFLLPLAMLLLQMPTSKL